MMFPHMVEEKVCGSGGRDCSDSRNKMCMLSDGIDNNDDGIVPCVRGRSASSDISSDISLSPLYIPPHRR